MAQYINKAAVVAEIERRRKTNKECMLGLRNLDYYQGKVDALNDILSFLDTHEVKEVDLEKHLKEDIEDVFFDLDGVAVKGATHYLTVEELKDLAKHFFELGLKAQKGE